jgi:hypothetical protein
MMCYRDTTFCAGGSPCCVKFNTCKHALTEVVKENAELWWGAPGAPIAKYTNPNKLPCYESRNKETKHES